MREEGARETVPPFDRALMNVDPDSTGAELIAPRHDPNVDLSVRFGRIDDKITVLHLMKKSEELTCGNSVAHRLSARVGTIHRFLDRLSIRFNGREVPDFLPAQCYTILLEK